EELLRFAWQCFHCLQDGVHYVLVSRVEAQNDWLPRPGDYRPVQQLSLPRPDASGKGLLRGVEVDVERRLVVVRCSLLVKVVLGVLYGPMLRARLPSCVCVQVDSLVARPTRYSRCVPNLIRARVAALRGERVDYLLQVFLIEGRPLRGRCGERHALSNRHGARQSHGGAQLLHHPLLCPSVPPSDCVLATVSWIGVYAS